MNVDALRQHVVGLDSAGARRRGRRRPAGAWQTGALDGHGRRAHLGLGADRMDTSRRLEQRHEQDRIHVPRPGLVRGRHGSRHRRGRARGDGRLRRGQRGLGHGPEGALLRRPGRGSRRHRGAAARARHDVPRDRRCAAGARHRARRASSATRSASSPRSARRRRSRRAMRSRSSASAGIAMADGGRGSTRLDGRDPRARRRGGRGALPEDLERVAGELQLPGPARHLGRDAVGRRGVRRGGARGRAPRDQAARLGRVPLAARRARGRAAAPRGRERASRSRAAPRSCRP